MRTCICISNHVLVHVSGVHCHVRESCTGGSDFVYFTVQYCIGYGSTISFFFNDTATTEIYTLSLHDALPILAKNKEEERVVGSLRRELGKNIRDVLSHPPTYFLLVPFNGQA